MRNKGFTLVELLAVIVVLAIIALIGFSSVGNIISSTQDNSNKLTMKNYAKAVDQAIFLYEMNNSDSNLSELNSTWLKENVKFEKATVECEYATYDKTSSLYGCKVNDSDKTYCYTSDTAVECNKNKLSKIYGNSTQNGTPTPTSPVEIQSVGEKTKNLFDVNKAEKNKGLVWLTGLSYALDKSIASDFIEIKNNVNYISKYTMQVILYDKNFNYINSLDGSNPKKSFIITDENCKYIKISFRTVDNNQKDFTTAEDIMLEENNTATEYEPYGYKIPITVSNGTETKTTNIYLKEPLRKVGEYADYLDLTSKKVVRNTKEIVFNGTESWQKHNNLNTYYVNNTSIKHSDNISCYSDKYKGQVSGAGNSYGSGNMWIQSTSSYPRIYISNDNYATVDTFKTYLASNNVTGYFVLETPTEESIDVPEIPSLTGNVTYSIGTNIKPSSINYTTR